MDDLTLLRKVRSSAPAPLDSLDASRARLAAAIAVEDGASRPRYARRVAWIGGASLASGAVALLLVVSSLTGGIGGTGASAAAADILHEASAAAIETSDMAIGAGEYLKVSTNYVVAIGDIWPETGKEHSWLATATTELYVPADRTGEWTSVSPNSELLKAFSPEGAVLAANDLEKRTALRPNGWVLRGDAGAFYRDEVPWSERALAAMPRDPGTLLAYIRESPYGSSGDDTAFEFIAQVLRTGIVPADLRSALYNAAALIPGVDITEKSAVLDGREGTAIGKTNSDLNTRTDIIIDTDTGTMIGSRLIQLTATTGGIPAGTAVESSAITLSVAEAVPSLPTTNVPDPG